MGKYFLGVWVSCVYFSRGVYFRVTGVTGVTSLILPGENR